MLTLFHGVEHQDEFTDFLLKWRSDRFTSVGLRVYVCLYAMTTCLHVADFIICMLLILMLLAVLVCFFIME